jgi:hypothetical protein
MKLLRTKRRNPRFAIDTPEIVFLGALIFLTLVKSIAFNGVM